MKTNRPTYLRGLKQIELHSVKKIREVIEKSLIIDDDNSTYENERINIKFRSNVDYDVSSKSIVENDDPSFKTYFSLHIKKSNSETDESIREVLELLKAKSEKR